MAHIQKLYDENGNVRAYKAVIEINGRNQRKRRSKTFDKRADAEEWKSRMIVDQNDGKYVSPDEITVGDFMLDWLENEKKPHIATTTYDNYLNRIKAYIIPNLGNMYLQKIEPIHISQFFNNLRRNGKIRGDGGLSENTLKKIYVLLNSAFKKAEKWRITNYNPVQAIESPQPEFHEIDFMSSNEIEKLLKTAKKDIFIYTFILFAFLTGMRKSEIMGLEWEDIDFNKQIVKVRQRLVVSQHTEEKIKHEQNTKRLSSRRTIKIPKKLVTALNKYKNYQSNMKKYFGNEYYNKKNFVFCRPDGKNYYTGTYNRKFNKLLNEANLDSNYNIHTLRHTFATLSLKNGVSAKIIQKILGHGNISTTLDTYSHVDYEMQEKAVNKLGDTIEV